MTRPNPALFWMTLFLGVLGAVVFLVREPLLQAFQANTAFNALIVGVLAVGILINYRQVLALFGEIRWIHEFRRKNPERPMETSPHLLAPMARMLAQREGGPLSLSALSLRSLLDSIRSRLDDSRDISRYMIGLLIFLGLLGTFWGLLVTIGDVGQVIRGLDVADGDAVAVFDRLKAGLEGPLSGMGIAFSSSLFGLAGSLVLGFLDLQSGHAQNRFFNELEEWLSGVTRLSSGALPGDGETGVEPYVQALLEQTADGLERLQREVHGQAGSSSQLHHQLATLNRRLADLGHHMENQRLSEDLRQELRLLNRTMAAALKGRETVD
ncbi:MAG: flagellar motor protein MotA [Xanthomonadales bacterium]|nr:flagellar motor protein MotA [Xanthomonadales bacterium]